MSVDGEPVDPARHLLWRGTKLSDVPNFALCFGYVNPSWTMRADLTARRVTYLFIAPPIAVALTKHPLVDSYDLTSLRAIVSGAAPLDEELGAAVARRLSVPVVQGYGMTELSPVGHLAPVADGGVIGVVDAEGEEIPKAFVVADDPARSAERVMEFVAAQVAPYKKCGPSSSSPRSPSRRRARSCART